VQSTVDFDELSRVAPSRRIAPPIIAGLLLMLAIALPWPLSVYLHNPRTLRTWLTEIDRHGASIPSHAPIYAYVVLFPNLLPWLPIFIAGCYLISLKIRKLKPIALALLLVIVPIVFMSFFPDRKERYLLPMAGPAAIIAAHAATRMKRAFPQKHLAVKFVWGSHWVILLIMAIGLPLVANMVFKGREGQNCCSLALVAITLIISLSIVAGGILVQSRLRQSFVYSGAALMVVLNAFFMYGWSQSTLGLSEMKPVADRLHAAFPQGQIIYFDLPPDGKPATYDLDIYLDRSVPVVADFPVDDGKTAAVVMLRKDGDPVPNFAGWKVWDDLVSRKHHWYMLTPVR
jgi:4-amino-4-deoxy-L-arabinose transferase-like glycosyltransferase